jgi:hypothetical protein
MVCSVPFAAMLPCCIFFIVHAFPALESKINAFEGFNTSSPDWDTNNPYPKAE